MLNRSHIRCIASDLDGTIVKEDNTVSESMMNMIEFLKQKQILFLPCTGRSISDLQSVFNSSMKLPVILLNGALFVDENSEVKISMPMLTTSVYQLEQMLLETELPCLYFTSNHIYGSGNMNLLDECINKYYKNHDSLNYFSAPIIRVHNCKDIEEEILKMETMHLNTDMKDQVKKFMQNIKNIQVSSSLPYNLEITSSNVNKATMLNKVLKMYKIDKEEIIYFGDSNNDLEVFQQYPYTIAPANACDEVLSIASDVCMSCDKDGVYEYLNRMFYK